MFLLRQKGLRMGGVHGVAQMSFTWQILRRPGGLGREVSQVPQGWLQAFPT